MSVFPSIDVQLSPASPYGLKDTSISRLPALIVLIALVSVSVNQANVVPISMPQQSRIDIPLPIRALFDFALSIVALAVMKNPILWLNVVGMSVFLVSDVYLVKTLFVKDDKRRDFYIMSTYLVAQCLLALGFVLIP